ncbi:EAL and modified HD-GYP domain-containing signal transduction protein [Nitrosomonas sp. PY1]|uniref:EAL and HDOD domain-containing protein n=1 Tax=Nitrosomonas sp. PY1 TaxID=1803906 RepID=UPI001FC85A7E|nr:HDOD domain-containing protein [Nitrosomonas sp. PY1]GKS68306.1 EAL and modified HD-GYP domain-containing signal transduction protein [Nitrosomonas sp. PY1]
MTGFFLGRQPILDRDQNLVAFELLFRQEENEEGVTVTNELAASSNVIVNAYGQFGIQNVLGNQRGFINADPELIMSDIISLLPSKHVVLELKETAEITPEFLRRCGELKKTGYQFALDNVTAINAQVEQLLAIVSIVKVNVLDLDEESLTKLVTALNRWPVLLLALKVETREQQVHCMKLGFQMFQGYFFAKPEVLTIKRADPGKLALLQLLAVITSDSDIEEIEKEFKHQPGLSYNLMRMVNSVANGLPQKVNSIKHAITMLGRKPLQKWIQLLLYTSNQSGDSMSSALLQTAAARGKLMELIAIAERPHDKNHHERAFMVGILSLLDVLLGMDMQQIVDNLAISEDMNQALVSRGGRLGQELKLVEASENSEVETMQSILTELGFLSLSELTNIEMQAIGWANRMSEATG